MVAGSAVRVYQQGTGSRKMDVGQEETGRSRNGLTSKLHAATDRPPHTSLYGIYTTTS